MLEASPAVQRVLTTNNIKPAELQHMVQFSALSRVPGFNRRYHHWLFCVTGTTVTAMRNRRRCPPTTIDAAAACNQLQISFDKLP